jgi:hypothetical protein
MARPVFHVINVYRVLWANFVRAFFAFDSNFSSKNECVPAAPRVEIELSLQFRSRDAKSLTSKMKMLRTIRGIFWIVLFFVVVHPTWAKDERSIKDLAKALTKLGPDVDPAEADQISVTAHTTARKLARDYHVVLNPEFQAFLVNVGARKRGWCGHWAQDIGTRLKELKPRTLVLHWGVAYDHTSSENNCLVVTARNQPFKDGIILDGWRRAGRLFWCPVIKDDEYEVEQHYGHSGITAWKENMQWSAWLQDYEPGKPKSKMATNNKATKGSSERNRRVSISELTQPAMP